MLRKLVPEMLDVLPPDDPAAKQSRRDLRRINRLMLHSGIVAGLIRECHKGPLTRVADLGCGDGSGALAVLKRIGTVAQGGELVLVDAAPVVSDRTLSELRALGWTVTVEKTDIFHWLANRRQPFDLVMTNLFLHHFEGNDLTRLLTEIAAVGDLFIATEPLRTRLSYLASCAVAVIGANAVTRHDAPVSVIAGFTGAELSEIWPGRVLFEGRRGPFTHAFAAAGDIG